MHNFIVSGNTVVLDLLRKISSKLLVVCGSSALADWEAWWILQHALSKDQAEILSNECIEITPEVMQALDLMLKKRVDQGMPLAYVLGYVPFCNLDILVRPPILIPRPETEEWVTWLITFLNKNSITNFCALDMCCGSGCIGLALAKAFSGAFVMGVDIFDGAIQLSNENKIRNDLKNIDFIKSNLFQNLPQNFKCDFIVSNPPYLAPDEYEILDLSVKLWEDKNALVADNSGMKFYEEILLNARKYLSKINHVFPQIILEIGPAQDLIEKVLRKFDYKNFEIYNDMQNKKRWVAIYLK